MREVHEEETRAVTLAYADDKAVVAETEADLQEELRIWDEKLTANKQRE